MTEQRLRHATVPSKPSLDGMETVWVARWEAQDDLRAAGNVEEFVLDGEATEPAVEVILT